jgi:CRP/FNR family transcriptional regulator
MGLIVCKLAKEQSVLDMAQNPEINRALSYLNPDLVSKITKAAFTKEIPVDTEILREGQFVKVIPIVLNGLIKVFTRHKDRDLLLYYIRPNESCIMSFAASLKNEPSKVFALTEEDTTALLLPVDKVSNWIKQYPNLNDLFYQQYNLRYTELLDTIHHVLFEKMDTRLHDYLKEKVNLTNKNPLKISHRQIASELGTAREVVSRVMKKLEHEGKVKQHISAIEIL